MDIQGWDSVSIVDALVVNSQLKENLSKVVQTFDYDGTSVLAGAYTISGSFGAWQIVGGSDTLIWMKIPIETGTVTLKSNDAKHDISGMTVTVEITLSFVSDAKLPNVHNLRFDFRQVSQTTSGPGLVTPHSSTDPHKTGLGQLLEMAVAEVLVQNAGDISFIFASTGIVKPGTAKWLAPIASAYSYHKPVDSSSGYLAILSVTDDRSISGYSTQIDSDLIDRSVPLSFIISGDLFLHHVIMPSLPKVFKHASASKFTFSSSAIHNRGSFDLNGVEKGAITYTPNVGKLKIAVDANALKTQIEGRVGLHLPDARLDFYVSTANVLKYDKASKTFSFDKDDHPTTKTSKHIPWYDDVLIALSGPLGLAIFETVEAIVPNEIGSSLNSGDGSGRLPDQPSISVRWTGLEAVQVTSAGLSDAFYMRADLA